MPSEIASRAQELEVLVARAVRRGRLGLDELLETYADLAPGGHGGLGDDRRVDLDAMVGALGTLPRGLVDAREILVVPRLEPYEHEPVASGMLPAGRLADGTLLIEASFGQVSVVNLVAPLCALAHELDKARPLLAAVAIVSPKDETAIGDPAPAPGASFEVAESRGVPAHEPGTGGPGTGEPGTGGPGTGEPGTGGPETDEPAPGASFEIAKSRGVPAHEPETGGPVTDEPGTGGPGTDEPGTDGPETGGPETGGLETSGPETGGPGTGGPGTGGPGTGGLETGGPETGGPGTDEIAAALARIAFALGVDPAALEAADDRAEGALLRLLLGQAELPEVRIHAEVRPSAVARRAVEHAQRVLAAVAEMGLMNRPTHVWFGGGVVTECLSPYARELRAVLLRWAAENPDACGDDVALHEPAGEDLLYALAHDFASSDAALAEERKVADRTVGVQRFDGGGLPFEVIDLGRVEASLCDARLPRWPGTTPAPVLVRITPDLEDSKGAGVNALLGALSAQLASVTAVLEGTALAGDTGTIVLPHLMVQWAGEHQVSIPSTRPWAVEDFLGYTDAAVQEGAVLSVSAAALLSPTHVGNLARTYGVSAIEVGASGLINAVAEARWSGAIPAEATVRWALVSAASASTGRPTVATVSAYAAIAIAALRDIAGPRTEPRSEPEPPVEKAARPRPGRSFVIKA